MAAANGGSPQQLDFNSMPHEQQLVVLAQEKSQLDGWVAEIPDAGMKTIIERVSYFVMVLMNFTINMFNSITAIRQEIKNNKDEMGVHETNLKTISDVQDTHKGDLDTIKAQIDEIPRELTSGWQNSCH